MLRRLGVLTIGAMLTCALGAVGISAQGRQAAYREVLGDGKILHIVIIVQENRSVDNLFNGFPGADTAGVAPTSSGARVQLHAEPLAVPWDPVHRHSAWETEYAGGRMNGFDREPILVTSRTATPPPLPAYSFVPRHEVEPYWTMARAYTFADRMFQTNEGPSFPAHLYIVSGTSAINPGRAYYVMDNPVAPDGVVTAGCDSPIGTIVALIDPLTNDQTHQMYPCLDHQTIWDLLDGAHVTWRYYQERLTSGLWFTPDAYKHIRYGSDYSNVRTPNTAIFSDIASGRLAAVSWVIPTAAASDHASLTDGSGPSWVAAIVNAIGRSAYWDSTAIFVTWDDWGGWYDHVQPPRYNYYELGFRVPLIVISPYAKRGYVSHAQHEFGSILKFTEEVFGLGSLLETDVRADDLGDCFNFERKPMPFTEIPAPLPESYFEKLPADRRSPDDD